MALFNFFKRNTNHSNGELQESPAVTDADANIQQMDESYIQENEITKAVKSPDIPEDIFIEYATPKPKHSMEPNDENSTVNDLQTLYRYLEQNLEKKGYEDALINPDTSYMEEQIAFLGNELGLLISKVKSYYSGYMRKIDFHIETRKRSGMIETVDELITHKETILEEIQIISTIEEDSINGRGLSQSPVLSYKRGFRNGFAAITYNSVLGRRS